jgi:DEP domain-containing protein 5
MVVDSHYFYKLTQDYVNVNPLWWPRGKPAPDARKPNPNPQDSRRRLILSQSMVIDVDPGPNKARIKVVAHVIPVFIESMQKSDQAETVILHHDIIHNPENVFHFELQWIGTTAQVIEDQIRSWSARIEGYGLTLVEAYVTQVSDIRERNPFQSCFPIRLRVKPPVIPDLHLRIPPGTPTKNYFEYALLREFDFTLDTEASDMYPTEVDVHYSYRRSPCDYSQFVHRSGVIFVQVLGGERGFVLLSNRLMGPGRMGTVARSRNNKVANSAEAIRTGLNDFCKNEEDLNAFYQRQIELLPPIAERSPLTSISEEPSVI